MGNADDDAEPTSDWRSHQPPPQHPAAPPPLPPPQQSAPPQPWGSPPSPPWQPQQTYGSPPPAEPPPFSTHPASWGAVPPSGPPPASWSGAEFGATPPPSKKSPVLAIVAVVVVLVLVAAASAVFYVLRDGGDNTTPAAGPTNGENAATPGGGPSGSISPSSSASASSTPGAGPRAGQGTLASLLSSALDLAKFANGDSMTPSAVVSTPFSGFTVSPSSCNSAIAPGASASYAGSGYSAFAGQAAIDASGQHKVIQAVTSFLTPAEAQSFYDTQVAAWRGCKYTTITVTDSDGSTSEAKSGAVGESDGTANLLLLRSGSSGRDCERGLTARNNIVVDVRVCSPTVGSSGWQLARDIGERITGNR